MIASKPLSELKLDPNRYYLTAPQRRAVWNNEISMFIVLAMPLIVATFWYGSTIQVVVGGHLTDPASLSRGIGLTLFISLFLIVGSAVWLFTQPAAERVANAQPVRGARRISFAAFDALLVFLNTYQTLTDGPGHDHISGLAISTILGIGAGLIAYVAMHSVVDIPGERRRNPLDAWRAQIDTQ